MSSAAPELCVQKRTACGDLAAILLRKLPGTYFASPKGRTSISNEVHAYQRASHAKCSHIDAAREDARKKIEEDLGKVDKRLIDLRTKLSTAKTTKIPRADLEQSLRSLQAKSEAVKRNIPEIQSASPATLGSVKTDLESRISEIEKSLDDLERKV